MTSKKLVIVIVTVVVVLGLLIAVFVGGIIGFAFYSIGKSEAATTARAFLRNSEKLKQDIGAVKDFGSIVTGNISVNNGDGTAILNLKVIGERKTVNASVEMIYRNGKAWRVTAASYRDDTGKTVDLLNPYDSQIYIPRPAA